MKRKILNVFFICLLLILYIYVCDIDSIPERLILIENEEISYIKLFGLSVDRKNDDYEAIQIASQIQDSSSADVKLFGIKLKEIKIDEIEEAEVIPLGSLVGMKLYTNGVLVVGMSEIYGDDNKAYKPYENTGISEGDTIIKINNTNIASTDDLIECINKSNGEEILVTYIHDDKTQETKIVPVRTEDSEYKVGLWVRDTAAGVGTATFYDETTEKIAILGHGILDVDTEELIDISTGELTETRVISVAKAENGKTGKIQGMVDGQMEIGKISKNTYFGIYGRVFNKSSLGIDNTKKVKVALRNEIEVGDAILMCSFEEGIINEYNIEIEKIYINNYSNNKSMQVRITDEKLLEKTGGIIQGMSGSPIIQNGKLIGALTHVLVQSPTEGYAVFADIMIKEMREVD